MTSRALWTPAAESHLEAIARYIAEITEQLETSLADPTVRVRLMNAERAYRNSVLPLSALLAVGGMIFAVCAWGLRAPITSPFPFVESATLNRNLFGVAGLVCVGIGVGLFLRHRFAWYALLVYLGVGVLLPALSALDARMVASRGYAFPILGSILNGAIGVGIYFAVRPAFAHSKSQCGPSKVVNPSGESGGL